jgi:hypothetical protein
MLATSFNTIYATAYEYNISQTIATVRTPTVQLQSGTAGSSTISNGVYATVTVTAPILYVPVTLTNNAGSATPNPFQALIQPNPSSYSTYEASNLGNIRFCSDSLCTTMLNSWLEGCGTTSPYGACSTSSTSATFWVKITSPISSGGGKLTVYMVFLSTSTNFDGNVAGESPNLSTTYGQYDNGAKVFLFYDNFAGTALNSTRWTQLVPSSCDSSATRITVNNGLNVTTTDNNACGFLVSKYQTSPAVAETYTSSGNSILGVSTSTSVNNFIAPYYGYSMDWYSSYDDIEYEGSSYAELTHVTETTFPAGVWQVTWSATASEYFVDGAGKTYTATYSGATMSSYSIYIGQSNGATTKNLFRWARMRAYPPGNTMPSVSFGSTTSTAGGTILTFNNSGSSSWLANLAVVGTPTNTARLYNLTISFQNPSSKQIILGTGVTNQNSGPQVSLAASSTTSITMGVTVNSAGTSTVTMALKIQVPPSSGATSAYCYDIISLTVN